MKKATNICPLSEIELDALAEADAQKLDAFFEARVEGRGAIEFAAKKAASHLRAMREVRRMARQESLFWQRKLK